MKAFLKSKPFLAISCVLFGALSMFLAQKFYLLPKTNRQADLFSKNQNAIDPLFNRLYDDEFFGRSKDPFEEMRRMREHMVKGFRQPSPGGGIFGSWYGKRFGGGDVGEVNRREDDKYIYYEIGIKDLTNDKVNVKVEDGQISISGQIERKSDAGNSLFTSNFHRSFPVPLEVDAKKVQIERDKDKLVVKFPKIESGTKEG